MNRILLVGVVLLAACTSSPESDLTRAEIDATSTSAPATTGPDTATDDASTTTSPRPTPPIEWSSCSGGECATYPVPLDYSEFDGPTIELSVFRKPATGDRIGALFFNFGGPGAGAAEILRLFPVPDRVGARFDLVAMDPRGVGGSTPLDCGLEPAELYGVDPTFEDDADERAFLEVSRRYVEDCGERRADLLPHVGSRDVARDMDTLRAAMGDDTLNYIGYSYGTSIGQAYADLFPGRVRAMVLDGVVDPAGTGIEGAREQAAGFEVALRRWADACPERTGCRFDDPIDAVDTMLERAEAGIASSDGKRTLGPGEAAIGLAMPLYNTQLWARLDRALADALDGDGAQMIGLADTYLRIVDYAAYFAVNCIDDEWPDTTDELFAAAKAAAAESPRFGESITVDYVRCVLWPAPADPLEPTSAPDAPPIVVVSGTGDPATPYETGVRVAERLAAGVLVTYEGDGHTITFQGSSCVDSVIGDYLIDLAVPADGTVC